MKDDFCFSFFFNFSFKFCTLCNEISWQVNLSRLYFPWIFRWSYFNSFWLHFESPLCQRLICSPILPPMSNTPCYCKIVKVKHRAAQFLLFSSPSFSSAESFERQTRRNSVPLLPCWKIKKRSGGKSLLDPSDEPGNFQLNKTKSGQLQGFLSWFSHTPPPPRAPPLPWSLKSFAGAYPYVLRNTNTVIIWWIPTLCRNSVIIWRPLPPCTMHIAQCTLLCNISLLSGWWNKT